MATDEDIQLLRGTRTEDETRASEHSLNGILTSLLPA